MNANEKKHAARVDLMLARMLQVPEDAIPYRIGGEGELVVFEYVQHGKPAFKIFAGRQAKPQAHEIFKTEAERTSRLKEIRAVHADMSVYSAEKSELLKERKKVAHGIKEGDIFANFRGGIHGFYLVTATSGKSITIRKIGNNFFRDGSELYALPEPQSFSGPPMKKIPDVDGHLNIDGWRVRRWDGKPQLRVL